MWLYFRNTVIHPYLAYLKLLNKAKKNPALQINTTATCTSPECRFLGEKGELVWAVQFPRL